MNLIRLGDRVINLDHVRDVDFSGGSAIVRFVAGTAQTEPVRLRGVDALALRLYLEREATDLRAPARAEQAEQAPAIEEEQP